MIGNIIYTVIFIMIVVPSWQIGSIKMEKMDVTHILQEHANNANKYNYSEKVTKDALKRDLEREGLPSEFTFEALEGRKVRISYQYHDAATVFGYTYYQTSETLSAETTKN